jgi:oligoribonuclease NrnB/cAMP/cGMP phosphodiesterase (DHH superfamily)
MIDGNNRPTHVLYHDDNDGFGAAWAIHKRFPELPIKYIPVNYNQDPPDLPESAKVAIVDFSYPLNVLLDMVENVEDLLVIDHHKTAEADLRGLQFCVFDMEYSGAVLTWKHFFGNAEVPWMLQYIQDRDLFKNVLPDTREINAAISAQPRTFERWDSADATGMHSWADLGKGILDFTERLVDRIVKEAHAGQISGIPMMIANSPVLQTEITHRLLDDWTGYQVSACWFERGDGKLVWRLTSRGDVDVSLLAKKKGGGGHKCAAGYVEEIG